MKIVFYSSNSNNFDGTLFHYYNYPSNTSRWNSFIKAHPEHEYIFISELPGMFLLDIDQNKLKEKSEYVKYFIQKPDSEFIFSLKPDLVIAATFWVTPFDWLPIADSIVAEELKAKGIKTICHNLYTSSVCFDKHLTQIFLSTHNFNIAKSIYVNHELFWAERNRPEIKENIYKESIFSQMKTMHFPLVIKDTAGLSSYGMEVVTTYNQAVAFLKSKKNNGDKLVEEFIPGLQFGTEIHGTKETGYKVFYPFMFSVNQYGITSPKQSIKLGPVTNPKYKFEELEKELLRLAELLDFSGVAQVDLVFDGNKWFIIEINPRLSGMTQTILEAKNKDLTMALKLPILDENQLEELKAFGFIRHISQVKNDAAKQRRECGYCEIIFSVSSDNHEIQVLKEKIPDLIDQGFYETALKMLTLL